MCFAIRFAAAVCALLAVVTTFSAMPVRAEGEANGTVVSATGAPVAGARVYRAISWFELRMFPSPAAAVTDKEGHFALPGSDTDAVLVIVPPKNLGTVSASASVTFARIHAAGPYRITLAPATRFRVQFTDGDGKPLANRRVFFWREYDPYQAYHSPLVRPQNGVIASSSRFPVVPAELERLLTVRTDSNGFCRVPNLAQSTRYSVVLDAAPGRYPPPLLSQTLVTGATSETDLPPVRLSLSGVIAGRVTHLTSGKPFAGAVLRLYAPHSGYVWTPVTTTTDRNGRYAFTGLYPGAYSVVAPSGPHYMVETDRSQSDVPLAPGEHRTNVDFREAGTSQMVVHVRDKNGRALSGQRIGIEVKDASGWSGVAVDVQSADYGDGEVVEDIALQDVIARTDKQGMARFTIRGTEARLRLFSHPELRPLESDAIDPTRTITVREGQTRHVYFGPGSPELPVQPRSDDSHRPRKRRRAGSCELR